MREKREDFLSLPPLARAEAMHRPLPRQPGRFVIGAVVTVLLHALVIAAIWFRPGPEPATGQAYQVIYIDPSGAGSEEPIAAPQDGAR